MHDLLAVILAADAAGAGGIGGATVTQTGLSMGSALAIVCSWQRNRSILWAVIAGFLTWLYVIYFALTRREDEKK